MMVCTAAARSLPSSESTGVRVPTWGCRDGCSRVDPEAVVEPPAAQPVPDGGEFRDARRGCAYSASTLRYGGSDRDSSSKPRPDSEAASA